MRCRLLALKCSALLCCLVVSAPQLLEQMEKQRLQRMRGGLNDDEQDMGPAPGVPTGGYAARRAKQRAKTEGAQRA